MLGREVLFHLAGMLTWWPLQPLCTGDGDDGVTGWPPEEMPFDDSAGSHYHC